MMPRRPIRRRDAADAGALGGPLHPVLARVYAARGVRGLDDLELGLDRLLPIGSLDGVEAGAELIDAHMRRGSTIVVVGDFDCDGATASAIVVRSLRRLGHANCSFLVPDRFKFGYGLTPGIVELAAERQPGLLITVDNGVSSIAGVAAARARGIDVLVTDHHLPGRELPDATAMVNPNLAGSTFGSRALAGCGVAFYVMAALAKRRGANPAQIVELLDLVALGTVADVVPLDRNNRVLVAQGLRRIRAGRCVPGIAALAEVAGRRLAALGATDLGFFVGPRLNAAGRIDDMSIGIECLLTDDPERARALATQLDGLNSERRAIEGRMQQDAIEIVQRMHLGEPGAKQPAGLCLFDRSWHAGVVGLVASRVKEQVHRPVIAFAPAGDGTVRGSARSVPGVHVRDAIEAVATREPDLLEKFGGHAMAAGMTLHESNLPRFSAAFAEEVAARAEPSMLQGILLTDGPLAASELCLDTAEQLRNGGPWGQAFPEPTFDGEFAVVEQRTLGDRHLKLWVRPDAKAPPMEAIAFGWLARPGADVPRAQQKTQLVYRLDVNEYQGLRRPQMLVEYLEVSGK
jgi:single-stranded-DNA-specific exonuclease